MENEFFGQVFFNQYKRKLKNFIRLKVGEDEAEEVFQNTLISAYESLPSFSGKCLPFTWLCGIAKHEIADHYRKKTVKTILFSHLPWLENLASEALGPEQLLLRKEFEARVGIVMKGLKKDYREVLRLKYYQGLSIAQIAERLNENIKTIESRLFRARQAFAKAFSSYGS